MVAVGLSILLFATAYVYRRRFRSERDRLFRANQTLAARLRLIEEQTSQAIVILDGQGLVRRVNPAAEESFGYAEAELHGQSISRLMPEVPAVGTNRETEAVRKDGSRMPVRCKAVKFAEQETCLFFDAAFPSRRHTNPESSPTLEVAERVVSRIVRQLEGLLTTINGYTELALHGTREDDPVHKDLEEIAAASDTASHLSRHLLAFTGNQLVPVERIDLNAMLEGLQPQFGSVQMEFCAERLFVSANRSSLRQIILIFCGSARHRVGPDTAVQIVSRRRQVGPIEYAAILISDGGPALAPATLACLFEPLFLDREGLGVELSAMYGMVRNLGGLINVTSEEGRGTTFELLVPRVPEEPGAAEMAFERCVVA